ncbi:hypothetical protein SCYAM73S_01383 [Streptomyces cyaneofuscatus]
MLTTPKTQSSRNEVVSPSPSISPVETRPIARRETKTMPTQGVRRPARTLPIVGGRMRSLAMP